MAQFAQSSKASFSFDKTATYNTHGHASCISICNIPAAASFHPRAVHPPPLLHLSTYLLLSVSFLASERVIVWASLGERARAQFAVHPQKWRKGAARLVRRDKQKETRMCSARARERIVCRIRARAARRVSLSRAWLVGIIRRERERGKGLVTVRAARY